MRAVKLFQSYDELTEEPQYSEVKCQTLQVRAAVTDDRYRWYDRFFFCVCEQVIELNLNSIVPHVSGPKRPQDRVAVSRMKEDFQSCLDEKVTNRKT